MPHVKIDFRLTGWSDEFIKDFYHDREKILHMYCQKE
jgi:hypothetical protein